MAVQPYINFNGNCLEAVNFYAEVFGTKEPKIIFYGDAPSEEGFPLNEETKNLVLHAEIEVKGTRIMFSDAAPGMSLQVGNNITLIVGSTDVDEIKLFYDKLKVEGNVVMELQETFWSKCYGYLVDQFGIGWQLSHEGSHTDNEGSL